MQSMLISERVGDILFMTLNRPKALNALSSTVSHPILHHQHFPHQPCDYPPSMQQFDSEESLATQ